MVKYDKAIDLPDKWDEKVGSNLYLKKDFLIHLEKAQKIDLTYYCFYNNSQIDSLIVLHNQRFDMNMFTNKKPKYHIFTTIYLPLSISRPSIIIGEETRFEVQKVLHDIKGWSAIINAGENLHIKGFHRGFTCPRCSLDIRWKTFDEYIQNLRSGYRRRYNQAFEKSKNLELTFLKDNQMFDDKMHELYIQVFENSRIKMEKLEKEFFQDNRFRIMVAKLNDEVVGFLQLLENNEELIFEFIGFEHSLNSDYDIYHRFLFEIVRYGIDNNFKTIDFGQTADDAKLKLGCKYTYLYTHLRHSNPMINLGIKLMIKKMQYRFDLEPKFNVFK